MNQIEVAPGYGTLKTLLRLVKSFQEGLVPRAPAGSPNGGQWVGEGDLLAPNGRKSNLSKEQYEIVRSFEFKRWFGDWENDPKNSSKVIDENGEPQIMWHGSNIDFDTFDPKKIHESLNGFYFAYKKEFAESHNAAFVKPYFINLRRRGTYDDDDNLLPKNADGVMLDGLQLTIFDPRNIKLADGRNRKFNPKSGNTKNLVKELYNFREELVPRKLKGDPEGGQWTSEWITGGPAFEARAKTMRIPPAWTDVKINKDEDADLLATGTDAKGRKQYIYSQNHHMRQAELKFARNMELIDKAIEIEAENSKNLSSRDKQKAENAAVFALIMSTGIRPGSDSERGADKWAYGATTLEGRHVIEQVKGVRLRFVGKKGVSLDIPITDPEIAKMLVKRKAAAGAKGRLFNVSDSELRDYVKTLDGGNFHPKDFRTLKGTATALEEIRIKKYKKAKNEKEYKKTVKAIAKKVSLVLGNTPSVALKSYINPFVFLKLKP